MSSGAVWPQALLRQPGPHAAANWRRHRASGLPCSPARCSRRRFCGSGTPPPPRTDADTAPPDFHVLRRGVAAGAAAL